MSKNKPSKSKGTNMSEQKINASELIKSTESKPTDEEIVTTDKKEEVITPEVVKFNTSTSVSRSAKPVEVVPTATVNITDTVTQVTPLEPVKPKSRVGAMSAEQSIEYVKGYCDQYLKALKEIKVNRTSTKEDVLARANINALKQLMDFVFICDDVNVLREVVKFFRKHPETTDYKLSLQGLNKRPVEDHDRISMFHNIVNEMTTNPTFNHRNTNMEVLEQQFKGTSFIGLIDRFSSR